MTPPAASDPVSHSDLPAPSSPLETMRPRLVDASVPPVRTSNAMMRVKSLP